MHNCALWAHSASPGHPYVHIKGNVPSQAVHPSPASHQPVGQRVLSQHPHPALALCSIYPGEGEKNNNNIGPTSI